MAPTLGSFDRIEPFTVSIPANTSQAAPVERNTSFAAGRVVHLEVLVPPGHNGRTGFAIAQAHQPVYPDRAGTFVVGSGERFEWDMEDDLDNGNWQLLGYNTAPIAHSFYLRFYVVENSKTIATPTPIVTPLAL